MSDDFEVSDKIETDPGELHELVIKAFQTSLTKRICADEGTPWTQALESKHQERISALVAAAKSKGLATFKLISVRPDGRRAVREISIDKLSKTRVLQ
jgi:hypothetical protein